MYQTQPLYQHLLQLLWVLEILTQQARTPTRCLWACLYDPSPPAVFKILPSIKYLQNKPRYTSPWQWCLLWVESDQYQSQLVSGWHFQRSRLRSSKLPPSVCCSSDEWAGPWTMADILGLLQTIQQKHLLTADNINYLSIIFSR